MSLQNASVARHALIWSFIAQGICILPLLYYMPFWMPLMWIGVMLWRVQIYRGAWPFPSTKIKLTLAGICVAALLASFATIKGVEPLIGFLIVSIVLKVVEMRRRADVLLVVFTGFFCRGSAVSFFPRYFNSNIQFNLLPYIANRLDRHLRLQDSPFATIAQREFSRFVPQFAADGGVVYCLASLWFFLASATG